MRYLDCRSAVKVLYKDKNQQSLFRTSSYVTWTTTNKEVKLTRVYYRVMS